MNTGFHEGFLAILSDPNKADATQFTTVTRTLGLRHNILEGCLHGNPSKSNLQQLAAEQKHGWLSLSNISALSQSVLLRGLLVTCHRPGTPQRLSPTRVLPCTPHHTTMITLCCFLMGTSIRGSREKTSHPPPPNSSQANTDKTHIPCCNLLARLLAAEG